MALDVTQIPEETRGVFGGMTRLERDWIRDNPTATRKLSEMLQTACVDPILLSTTGTPPPSNELGFTVSDTAAKFGVPEWVAHDWHSQDRLGTNETLWGKEIRRCLRETPERWLRAVDLVDRVAHLVPGERVQQMQQNRRDAGRRCTERTAISLIVNSVIHSSIRRGTFESRNRSGRLEVRLAQ